MNLKYVTIMLVAVFMLMPAAFAQMSAVDFNSSPNYGPKSNSGQASNLSHDFSSQSGNAVDYTITQPAIGNDGGPGDTTTVVPEPGTLILMGLGLAAVGVRRKFKR